jgi:hypothetical protein
MSRSHGIAMIVSVLVVGLLAADGAGAGVSPQQKCQIGKNKAAGALATCRQGVEAAFARTGDVAAHDAAMARCAARFAKAWSRLEAKATRAGAACLDGAGTATAFARVIEDDTDNIATALQGAALRTPAACQGALETCGGALTTCETGLQDTSDDLQTTQTTLATCQADLGTTSSDLSTCQADLVVETNCGNGLIDAGESCDQANLNGKVCASLISQIIPGDPPHAIFFAAGTLACGAGCTFDTSGCSEDRFAVGTDTVTDRITGLQWERKTGGGGATVDCNTLDACPDPHALVNQYSWSNNVTVPSGFAFTNFLGRLNGAYDAGCFAGHCDWRLPTGLELMTLAPPGCTAPCIDPVFGVGGGVFWTSTTAVADTSTALAVDVESGALSAGLKTDDRFTIAVRTAFLPQ